jgi:hypothetical protein
MIPKELLKKIRRIEIRTAHLVNDVLAGQYHSAFKGVGMEFEEVGRTRSATTCAHRLERQRALRRAVHQASSARSASLPSCSSWI